MNVIGFPGLGIELHINEIAIPIPFLNGGIRWYALLITTGILLALWICGKELKRQGENPEHLYNLVLWALPVAIIGARIYYVLFSWQEYKDNLISVFYIWEGGIAVYGAVIAAFMVAVLYCRKNKLSLWKYFDIGAYGFLIGQIIGRWGNFVNGEAYGTATNLPWRMLVNGQMVHPTFLYESLWNFVGFLYIWLTRKKKGFDGRAISLYMIWYGIGRFWVEGLRIDSLMLGNLRVSQLVSIILIILGVCLYVSRKRKHKEHVDDMEK